MVDSQTNHQYITEVWKNELKAPLVESLELRKEVRMVTGDFVKGGVLHIPTVSDLTARDYTKGDTIQVEGVDSTDFALTIDKYKQAGIQIPDDFKEDSVYITELMSHFQVQIVQALMKQFESDVAHLQAKQTASDPNAIEGGDHRFVSLATDALGGVVDLRLANLALSKCKAFNDTATAYINEDFLFQLQEVANVLNQQIYGANQMLAAGGITGKIISAAQGARTNVGLLSGFQVYQNLNLDRGLAETIVGTAGTKWAGSRTITGAKANLFLGTEAYIGAMRTSPEIVEFRDNKTKSDIVHATFRYGLDLFRPESQVVCLTKSI